MRNSVNYKGTVTSLEDQMIADSKKLAGLLNLKEKHDELMGLTKLLNFGGTKYAKRHRVVIRPRLGKNNPNAALYKRGGPHYQWTAQVIRKEHGTRFDIYVQQYLQKICK